MKYSASFFIPSSKSSKFIAASTHWIIFPGANWPFLVLAAKALASEIMFSSPLAARTLSLRSLTRG